MTDILQTDKIVVMIFATLVAGAISEGNRLSDGRMQRELSTFPIPASLRMKLTSAGFHVVEDVADVKPAELSKGGHSLGNQGPVSRSKQLGISMEESFNVLKTVKAGGISTSTLALESWGGRSALELLHDEASHQQIITFSQRVDEMLGGGVPVTKITEFCGAPGVGKTQLSMQLCVDVQIPECFGGLGAEAVYIDTEGSFVVQRLQDMARTAVQHCQHVADAENNQEQLQEMENFTENCILSRVHYFRCHDYMELIALVHILPDFIAEKGKVRLIVVDSIAFHFRQDFEDYALRIRLLNGLAQSFSKIACQFKSAIVLTNQMTTRISSGKGQGSQYVPALGESWAHASTIRVILHWREMQRYATLCKHPSKPDATVPYQITTGGIRDVNESEVSHINPETPASVDVTDQAQNLKKRKREVND